MPKKFWSLVKNAGYTAGDPDSKNTPELPARVGYRTSVTVGDLYVADAHDTDPDGSTHRHLMLNPFASMPSAQITSGNGLGHFHWSLINDANGNQRWSTEGNNGIADHPHEVRVQRKISTEDDVEFVMRPKWFATLITCDDAEWASLDAAGVQIMGERVFVAGDDADPSSWQFGPIDRTAWGAGRRTAIENAMRNRFGLELPNEINNDRRIVQFFLNLGSSRLADEGVHS